MVQKKASALTSTYNNLETILLPVVNIISFDTKAAYVCGRIRAELEKRGTPLDLADLEIVSIAIANNLTLNDNRFLHEISICFGSSIIL